MQRGIMKRNEILVVIVILACAGFFPAQAHAVIDYASTTVADILKIFSAVGLQVDRQTAEAITVLALVIVIIAAIASLIGGVNWSKRGR